MKQHTRRKKTWAPLACALAALFVLGACYDPPDLDDPDDVDETLYNSSLAGDLEVGGFTASSVSSASNAKKLYRSIKQAREDGQHQIRPTRRETFKKKTFREGELVFFFHPAAWNAISLQALISKEIKVREPKVSVRVTHCTAKRFCLVHLDDAHGAPISKEKTATLKSYFGKKWSKHFRHVTFNDWMRPMLNANDTFYAYQWNLSSVRLQTAWDITTGSDDVVVAVVDSGIVSGHPDIVDRLVAGVDLIEDIGTAGDGNGRDTDPTDEGDNMFGSGQHSYHGSHVAGIIGAASNNDLGITGIMWSGKILPVRVLGSGGGAQFDILSGIYWAVGEADVTGVPQNTTPARIVNLSLGGEVDGETHQAWVAELDYILGDQAPYNSPILVAAAGNEDQDVVNVTPANIDDIISVGAFRFDGQRAFYSNWGAQVDLMAPGGQTNVDQNGDGQPDGIFSFNSNDYRWEHGTSMATPHVAGVLGLALAINPDLNQASAQQLLYDTVDQTGQCNEGCGGGLLNAGNLMMVLSGGHVPEPSPRLALDSDRITFFQGQSQAQVAVFNLGGGVLSYRASIAGPSASLFEVSPATGSAQAASGEMLNITLNRGGYTEGEAELTVTGVGETEGQSKTIPLTFRDVTAVENQVQTAIVEAFEVFEDGSVETAGVLATARRSGGFAWQIDGLKSAYYYVFAVGDDNNDGAYDSERESFGAYPNTAAPKSIFVDENQLLKGVDFALSFVTDTLIEGVGAPCQIDTDCSFFDDGECISDWPGGYCTRYCDDGFCGEGGVCVQLECDTGPCSICLADCVSASDCRSQAGYTCDAFNTCTPSGF
ncbi:MAG: hypothetical protein CMH56_17295 [Myxococcales bacterium]|nr:hypothetical protein [Myxococcales bacterium]